MIGAVIINKPKGITSSNVVIKVKKILSCKRVGHLGTLDPMATGVLVVCINKATRLFDYYLNKRKTYIAEFTFGYETDTFDSEGIVTNSCENIPTYEEVSEKLKKFIGTFNQLPPMYSAKKVNGKKAYQYAREGKVVNLKANKVHISQFEILQKVNNTFRFIISCSAGTYIRSLCRDLAHSLNSFATMTYLNRVKVGQFDKSQAIDYDRLTLDTIKTNLIPIEDLLCDFDKKIVNDDEFKKLINGVSINDNVDGEKLIMYQNQVVGIGKTQNGNLKIKVNLYEKEI